MKTPALFRPSSKDPATLNMFSLLVYITFYIVFGILLILLKDVTLSVAAYVIAAALIAGSAFELAVYLRSPAIRRITESRLALAMILFLTGILLAFNPTFIHDVLPIVWGLSLLFGSFLKIQYAFDQKNLNFKKWWILLIFAAFSLLIGILALLRPDFLGESKEVIIGILLVLEAVLDIAVFLIMNSALKKIPAGSESAAAVPSVPSASPVTVPVPEPENETEKGN